MALLMLSCFGAKGQDTIRDASKRIDFLFKERLLQES